MADTDPTLTVPEATSPTGHAATGPTGPAADGSSAAPGQDRAALPDWMARKADRVAEEAAFASRSPGRRLGDWIGDHGIKALAVAIVVAIGVPFAMMAWNAMTAPPGTPSEVQEFNAFLGTAAIDYLEGQSGVVAPDARPTGPFSAEQVAEALADVRRALIAARLDPRMLEGHDPEPFLALLAESNREELRQDFTEGSSPFYVTQIASKARLSDVTPRVTGEITYQDIVADDLPTLEITTRFTWVYPFQVSSVVRGANLVTVTDELVWHVPAATGTDAAPGAPHLINGSAQAQNAECESYEKGFFAPARPRDEPCRW